MSTGPAMPSGSALIRDAGRRLVTPPLVTLVGIALLLWGVIRTIQPVDGAGALSFVVLGVITTYVNIALILASADPEPQTSADHWLRSAWRRRTFWRYLLTELLVLLLVLLGAIAFLVPAFLVGASMTLGAQAAVLEGMRPLDAIRRSIAMTRPARRAVGTVYGVLAIVPLVLLEAGYLFEWDSSVGTAWIALEAVFQVLSALSVVALTRAFLILGGRRIPVDRPGDRLQ